MRKSRDIDLWLPHAKVHICAHKHRRKKRIIAVPVSEGSWPTSEMVIGRLVVLPKSPKCDSQEDKYNCD